MSAVVFAALLGAAFGAVATHAWIAWRARRDVDPYRVARRDLHRAVPRLARGGVVIRLDARRGR